MPHQRVLRRQQASILCAVGEGQRLDRQFAETPAEGGLFGVAEVLARQHEYGVLMERRLDDRPLGVGHGRQLNAA